MDIKKAIERLGWRFSQGKGFAPNENDIEALNGVIAYYNDMQTSLSISQEPFAKIYMFMYLELLRHRSFNDPQVTPAKLLKEMLNKPLKHHLQDIQDEVNRQGYNQFFKDHTSNQKDVRLMSEQEIEQDKKELSEIDVQKYLDLHISYEQVKDAVLGNVNKLLEGYVQTK